MVVGHHQPVLIWSRADQRRTKGGPLGEVADSRPLSDAYPVNLGVEGRSIPGKVDVLPGRHWICRNYLHRLGELLGETGHQVGVAGYHRLYRFAQPLLIKWTAQRDVELDGVDVVAVTCCGDGVK